MPIVDIPAHATRRRFPGRVEFGIPDSDRRPRDMSLFNDLRIRWHHSEIAIEIESRGLSSLQQQYPNPDFPDLKIPSTLAIISGTNFRPHTSAGSNS